MLYMSMPMNIGRVMDLVKERGPRYAITGSLSRGLGRIIYADTAEAAKRAEAQLDGCHDIHIYPPEGSVDLGLLGRARHDAKTAFDEATATLRAGVLRALEDGRAEAEVARAAGVDRMTVRAWAGKK